MSNDRSYFIRRAAEERSAAAHAAGDPARKAHREMARRYRGLAQQPSEDSAVSKPAA